MGIFSALFGTGKNKADLGELINQGATVVDVRTKNEYSQGHIKGSINIPLDQLGSGLKKISKNKPVITVCASGMRSASAKSLLKKQGFETVENGGSWMNLRKYYR